MAGIGCLLKDTAILEVISDLLRDLAADSILRGRPFKINDAFNSVRAYGIEVDLETVGAIYERIFDLSDGNFSTQAAVDTLVGREFYEMLDNIIHTRPFTGRQTIDTRSPGKAAADGIGKLFKNGMSLNLGSKSMMKLFQDKMLAAAKAYTNRTVFPPRTTVDNRPFEEILGDAFDLNNTGYTTVYGTLNSAIDVFNEFKLEMERYLDSLRTGVADGSVTPVTLAQFEIYTDAIMAKGFDLLLSQKEMTTVVKEALMAAGFFTTKIDGGVRTEIFDWTKLTDAANDVDFLKENVTRALTDYTAFTPPQIDIINSAMEREYQRLREDIIMKRLNELKKRNQIKIIPEKNTQTRTMAKLYSLGWFEEAPDTYGKIVNTVLELEDIDIDTFNKLEVLGKALNTLYKEEYASDEYTKTAINSINEQIGVIINAYASSKSNHFKMARILNGFLSLALRSMITSISNSWIANQVSGLEAKLRNGIFARARGESSAEKRAFTRRLAGNVFSDIALNGGLQYGELSGQYMNRNEFDSYLNTVSDSKIWHASISFLTGRALLDGSDSYFKATLVHNYFIHNLLKILVDKFGYTKENAINEINQQLYGASFEDAILEAQTVINKINAQAGKIIVKDNPESIERLASDMVMANLLKIDGRINHEIVTKAYRAAYRSGGYEIGHVPNNFLSDIVAGYNSKLHTQVKAALKDGNYKLASRLSTTQSLYNTWVNPFGNGGTNWIVIQAERLGFGILRSLNKDFKRFSDIDITTNAGINDLEDVLFNENKKDVQMKRGVAGAITNLIILGTIMMAITNLGDDDEEDERTALEKFNDFFQENKWFRKYTTSFSLEYLFLGAMLKTGNYDYLLRLMNLEYDRFSFKSLFTEAIRLRSKGEVAESWGKLGEAFGTLPMNPITFYRMMYQAEELFDGLSALYTGEPMTPRQFTKSRSFLMGYFSYGMTNDLNLLEGKEWYDVRNPPYDLSSLPGAGEATLANMKEMGFNNMNDLVKHIRENYPGQTISVGLRSIKVKDAKGRMMPLFDKNDAAQIEEIIENGNRLPSITLGDTVTDPELLKKFKRSGIATMSQLVGAIDNGSFSALMLANGVSPEDEKFMRDQAQKFIDEVVKK